MIDVVLNVAVFATSVLCIVAFSAWAQGKKDTYGAEQHFDIIVLRPPGEPQAPHPQSPGVECRLL